MLKADGKLCSDFTTECSLVKAEASFLSLGSCVGMYSVIFLRSSSLAWRGYQPVAGSLPSRHGAGPL